MSVGRVVVCVRMAPRKEDQPAATGGECRRVRSRGWRGSGGRRAESWAYAEVVVVGEVGGGLAGM